MRKLFIAICCLVALALACHAVNTNAGDKKLEAKVSAAEIEKLVGDLDSRSFEIRDRAQAALRAIPRAQGYLKRRLDSPGNSLEQRIRIAALEKEISGTAFKSRFANNAKQLSEAPLDLIVEDMLANRRHVGTEEWKLTVDVVNALSEKVCRSKGIARRIPNATWQQYRNCTEYIGGPMGKKHGRYHRAIVDALVSQEYLSECVFVAPDGVHLRGATRDCIIVSSRGAANRDGENNFIISDSASFIYCDGNLVLNGITGSMIVATGNVRAGRAENSIVIEKSRDIPGIRFFRLGDVGLKVTSVGYDVRVDDVVGEQRRMDLGLLPGDIIKLEKCDQTPTEFLAQLIRQAIVLGSPVECTIRRAGAEKRISSWYSQ